MQAYIYDAVRTPRGRGKKDGSLHEVPPVQLVVTLIRALVERNGLDTEKVEDLILGCVTQIMEQGSNIAKTCAQAAGMSEKVAGVTLNRFCASGLEAVNQAAAYVMSGMVDLIMAGGVESMSRCEMASDGGSWYMDPQIAFPGYFIPQGISADLIATKFGYSRRDCDEFAAESHRRAAHARANGYFNRSIVPVKDLNGLTILDKDETIRPDTTPEKLAELNPSFEMMGEMGGFDYVAIQRYPECEKINHVHHAGNSSGIVDGAALMLIGNEKIGKELGLKPRAKILSFAVTGTEPTIMLEGPAPASRKALQRAGLKPQDVDLYEVNEAFAVVPLRFMREMGVSHDRVNVNGGAIAMGHPLGATGCMILGTALDELERTDKRRALATLCVGGGMGIAAVIERV
ncbi:MAG: acetyl-CoA C-acetyltransferase [Bacteroidia bacterium]|nr:acetyl-CoA C-acetyltransferase [Bacteroidia bacterium]MDW8333026.1 acetyl-CoA C-acetyltransferase [Bacteroidia bacterium]